MTKCRLLLWNRVVSIFVLLATIAILNGCGGGGSSAPTPNADPTGYYINTGSLSKLGITDLQAMFYKGHVTLFSQAQGYGFAGTYTVSGNTISANLIEYTSTGAEADTATFKATFNTTDHSISGSLNTTAGVMDASFNLNYASGRSNSTVAAILKDGWTGTFMNETTDVITVNITDNTKGAAILSTTSKITTLTGHTDYYMCDFNGTLTPVSGSLYNVSIILSGCSNSIANTTYTGMAALNGSTLFITSDGSPITNIHEGVFGAFK